MPRRYIRKRANSFVYAFRGIATLIRTQPNAVIHLFATIVVLGLGWHFKLSPGEWLAILLSIALVWMAEAFNTALEFLTDLVSPDFHPLAGKAKDVAAAGVLMAAILAVAVGVIVFGPKVAVAFP
jgi:diacylglycerol kinase (ATP)